MRHGLRLAAKQQQALADLFMRAAFRAPALAQRVID
jgi:hypothetical protein